MSSLFLASEDSVRRIFQEHGVEQLSEYVNEKTPIKFRCTRCGKEHSIYWSQIVQGINPNFICIDCSYLERSKSESHTYKELQEIFESRGSKFLVPDGVDLNSRVKTKEKIRYICTYCGEVGEMQYFDFKRGRRQNLRCVKCSRIKNGNYIAKKDIKRVSHLESKEKNFKEIQEKVAQTGAELLTTFDEYVDKNSYIRFKCSNCKREYKVRWKKFEEGQNQKLLCEHCLPNKRVITTEFVKEEFGAKGAEVIGEYVNSKIPILFKCSQCGSIHSIKWYNYTSGRNKYLLCDACKKGIKTSDPLNTHGTYSENGLHRSMAEARARDFCKTFYNLQKNIRGDYESHHIKQFKNYPDLIYSLANLYPLPTVEHHTNNFSYYHYLEESRNPENWPDAARLPYHNYDGFKFFDLNKYMITDFILEEDPNLFTKKKYFAEQGIVYIPFYFQEMDVFQKAFISYSMIRSRLAKIPEIGTDIYKYTGQRFRRFNTRKLDVRIIYGFDAMQFFNTNHIQGYVDSVICLGLYSGDELVAAMSFGPARTNNWRGEGHYELLRFCSVLNSSVPGAASKLFKYFVNNYHPELIVTFCDCRFSSVDPNETVYPKLGFVYDGYSNPNYKYSKDGVLYSRQQFMKYKLSSKLDIFDPSLTETENMRRNGYQKLYDCGNFRYVWRRS